MENFDLNNKRFVTAQNNQGLSSSETTFHYLQQGEIITATYQGGSIRKGFVLGKKTGMNQIELLYNCVTIEGKLLAGESNGTVSKHADGRLQMNLDWKWLNGDQSGGKSEYIEVQ